MNLVGYWENNPDDVLSKKLKQIISWAGDGNITHPDTAEQLRNYFSRISSEYIRCYIDECLSEKIENGGFVLQDLVNEIGSRLGFKVQNGRYRGVHGQNGFDGLWETPDGHYIVIESKTTDAYRLSLQTLKDYKKKLVAEGKTNDDNCSILIVAGRYDTGELEAQIRGSKFAWEIRLISIDSLIRLLQIKESMNDSRSMSLIYEVLKPQEYTCVDKLISLLFLTSEDSELDAEDDDEDKTEGAFLKPYVAKDYTQLYSKCIQAASKHLGYQLLKKGRILYGSSNMDAGIIVCISKAYQAGKRQKFWYGYHSYFATNLATYKKKYIAFGCDNDEGIVLIPFEFIDKLRDNMNKTERKNGKCYWHVIIFRETDGKYRLFVSVPEHKYIDISEYRI